MGKGGILDSLQISPLVMGMQILLFIILWVVMNQIFWKPMLQHLKDRDKEVSDAYKTVSDMQHEMETLRSDYQSRITQIEADARAKIQDAIKEGQTERERLLSEAKSQAEMTLKQGSALMQSEKVDAIGSLTSWMSGLAHNAVTKAIGNVADPDGLRRSLEASIAGKQADLN